MRYEGITEERTRGWGPGFFIAVVLILVLVVVVFVMLWIATGVAETAALVTMLAILVLVIVGMILLAFSTGSKQAHDADRDIVASMAAIVTARNAAQVIDNAMPQIGETKFLSSGNQMHRSDKVEAAAVKVWRDLCPHTPPTRQNIMSVTQSSSAEFCSLVLDYLRDKELVHTGGQGKVSAWK